MASVTLTHAPWTGNMSSVESVSFSLWTRESILQSSLFEVTNARCLTNGVCTPNGLRDPRFGCVGAGTCAHCHKSQHLCQGHWGHIVLRMPVLHIGLVGVLIQELRAICAACGVRGTTASGRMLKRCACGAVQSKYAWNKRQGCIQRDDLRYSVGSILAHLVRGGGNVNLVLTVLPVPPIQIRPPLTVGSRTRGENDLTYRLQNIMRKNLHLGEAMGRMPKHVVMERFDALQHAVSGYFDHDKVGNTRTAQTRREYTSLTGRIKGKEGTMRGHCMGKRVNQSGRCVVTGDNRLRLGEIGIPESIARTLTKPVTVTSSNQALLQEQVRQGIVRYIVRPNGARVDCARSRNARIAVGWVLERSLQDGDMVLFNRQPSLHKMSIMAHAVRVLPHDTLRFNVACTTPYNADFDGDEMNIHVPQTLEAQAEAREIMAVKYQVVSPQASRPVISAIQDTMLGAYLLSSAEVDRASAFHITQQPIDPPYTGRRILSQLLPPGVFYGCADAAAADADAVCIENSVMLCGSFRKRDLGSASGSLIHVLFNDCGPQATVDFLYDLEQVVSRFLSIRGFTVGMRDLQRSKELTRVCVVERQRAFSQCQGGAELDINQRLNKSRDIMGAAAMSELTSDNQFYNMIYSGSKGSMVNITQVQAAIGQQNVKGQRIQSDWTDRTMTCFKRGDTTPQSRGFVPHTYLEGLTPVEMYFCAMAGREGLIDTAIKTAQTGYISRRLMKCLENIVVHHGAAKDGTKMIQFQYGDDGLDAMRVEHQTYAPCATARQEDLDIIQNAPGGPVYHLPIATRRIVRRLGLGLGSESGTVEPDLSFIDNELVRAFCAAHTPLLTSAECVLFCDAVRDEWDKCQVLHGESVGAIAAQSIGERATQCTLNTFHFAGVSSKNVTLGLPRLEELLNLTKHVKTPLTTFAAGTWEESACVVARVKRVSLKVVRGPVQPGDAAALASFWAFPDPGVYAGTPERWVVDGEVDIHVLTHRLRCRGMDVAYPDPLESPLFLHVWAPVEPEPEPEPEPELEPELEWGVSGAEWCKHVDDTIETSTTDLHALLDHVSMETARTLYTNDVHVMYRTYGIEAARATILREVRKILAHYGIDINVRHLLLLSDWMTQNGALTPMTRHGLKKSDQQQPLKQASFEEVVGVFLRAAVQESVDTVDSVSACILTGKPAAMGSNMVHVKSAPVPEPEPDMEVEDLFGDWVATAAPPWLQSPDWAPE